MSNDMHEIMKQNSDARGLMGGGLMEVFVYRNGTTFTPVEHDLPMGVMKECFKNATDFIFDQSADELYRYCEGYAIRPSLGMLIHHAWVVDAEGHAYDLTWRDSTECLYYGVVIDSETLHEQTMARGIYGVLADEMINYELMKTIDPSIEDYAKELVSKRKAFFSKIKALG